MSTETAAILGLVLVLFDWVIRIIALIIIPRDRKPTAAMAWLLAIFLIPFIGIVLFLLIGNVKLPKKRRERQTEVNRMITERSEGIDLAPDRSTWPTWFATHRRAEPRASAPSRRSAATPPRSSATTRRRSTRWPPTSTPPSASCTSSSSSSSLDDTTTRLLRRDGARRAARRRRARAARPHRVHGRVRRPTRRPIAELDRIGAKWSFMLPVQPFKGKYQRPDLRNHRKLVVVDGRVGYTGSQNLIDRSYNSKKNLKRGLQWQELVTRVTGPIVTAINAVFLSDWYCRDRRAARRRRERAARPWCPSTPRPMRWTARSCRAARPTTARTTCACSSRW